MIGNRIIYGFILSFLTLVIIISTAPIVDKQWISINSTNQTIATTESIAYDDKSSESNETLIELTTVGNLVQTTAVPEIITTGLLFVNETELTFNMNDILNVTNRLLVDIQDEIPSTPTTESPELSQSTPKQQKIVY